MRQLCIMASMLACCQPQSYLHMVVEWIWSSLDDAELQMLLKIVPEMRKYSKGCFFKSKPKKNSM